MAVIAVMAAPGRVAGLPATTASRHEDGDESQELRDSLAAFFGPALGPGDGVNPRAFAAAATTADTYRASKHALATSSARTAISRTTATTSIRSSATAAAAQGYNTGRITESPLRRTATCTRPARAAASGARRTRPSGVDTGLRRQRDDGRGSPCTVADGPAALHRLRRHRRADDQPRLVRRRRRARLHRSRRHVAARRRRRAGRRGDLQDRPGSGRCSCTAATSHGLYRLGARSSTTWAARSSAIRNKPGTPNAQVLNLVSDVAVRPGTNGQEVVAVRGWRAGAATNGLYVSTDFGHTFEGPLQPQGYVPQNAQGRGSHRVLG